MSGRSTYGAARRSLRAQDRRSHAVFCRVQRDGGGRPLPANHHKQDVSRQHPLFPGAAHPLRASGLPSRAAASPKTESAPSQPPATAGRPASCSHGSSSPRPSSLHCAGVWRRGRSGRYRRKRVIIQADARAHRDIAASARAARRIGTALVQCPYFGRGSARCSTFSRSFSGRPSAPTRRAFNLDFVQYLHGLFQIAVEITPHDIQPLNQNGFRTEYRAWLPAFRLLNICRLRRVARYGETFACSIPSRSWIAPPESSPPRKISMMAIRVGS